jgi:two-component system, cell cycle sensor histidine kinase and response regulator CckA
MDTYGPVGGGGVTSKGKILIVDDSEESLKLLSGTLSAEGYDVRPADSGELALAAVTLSPPELILLDMRMPDMSGLEVCRRLKSLEESRDIPVIFLSASLDFDDRLEGLQSGAVDFINKPFRREELLARLRTHLELARLRKDLEGRVAERTADLAAANEQLQSQLEAVRRAEEELRESEQRFRSIADTAPAGIALFSPEGLPTYASKWLSTFLGVTMNQLAADNWLRFVHPEDSNRLIEETGAAIREQRSSQIEHRLLRCDGEYRWVAVTATPRFFNGEFSGHIVIALDITELKRSQERALANQKLESLGVLAAGIAHDFNNLLSTILTYTDLALPEIPDESPAHESVSTIATVALRASEIVTLMMAYAGRADLGAFEPVDLPALIEEMAQLLKVSVAKATALRLNLEKGLPPIWANAAQLRQVVLNLIVNASEALETRTGTAAVSTSRIQVRQGSDPAESRQFELRDGDYVLLEVSDDGCGMTEDTKTKIFDPFFSTKSLGRGMGLAAVQGIVRGAGGAIGVVSAPGQGSTFKVWLPCSDRKQQDRVRTPLLPSDWAAGTVLLVDDEDALRVAEARALRREGFSVLEAHDGLAAVQLFANHSSEIGIVVLDMTLPGLSGDDVCGEIRRLKADVPVLFTSAQSSTGADDLRRPTGQRFLGKPYRLRELAQTIREMMASPDAQ